MENNNESLTFDEVAKFFQKTTTTPLNSEVISRPDTNPNATGLGYGDKSVKVMNLPKQDTTPVTAVNLDRPEVNPNATGLGYDAKPVKEIQLPKLDADPITAVDVNRPDKNPNATGLGYMGKALSFKEVQKFMVKLNAEPITTVNVDRPDDNPNATEPALKPITILKAEGSESITTTPLNSEKIVAPDFNPNSKITTTPVTIETKQSEKTGKHTHHADKKEKELDVHPEVLPVVVPDIKGAEDEMKDKDARYVQDAFGTTMNADGFGGNTHMNADGFGGNTFLNAAGGGMVKIPPKGWYKSAKAVQLYDTKGNLIKGNTIAKGGQFYWYGVSTTLKSGAFQKVKLGTTDFWVSAKDNVMAGAVKTDAPKSAGQSSPAPKPAAKPTVLVVDANTFYVTTQASTVKVQDKKTGKTSNVIIAAKVMKNMGYKASVVIDTNRAQKVNGKTYYRITKLKGNGGWENRLNSNPKLPTYWVLANDYTLSKDQSQAATPLKAEGMYMDGVNGYTKPNSLYASGRKYRHDEGDESLDLGTDGVDDGSGGMGDDDGSGDMGGGMDMQSQMDAVMIQAAQQNSMVNQMQNNPLAMQQQMALSAMQQQQLMSQMQQNPAAVMQQMQQNPALMQQVQQNPALMQQMQQNPAMYQQVQQMQQMQPQVAGYDQNGNAVDQYGNLMTNVPAQTAATTTGQLPSGTQGQLTQRNTSGQAVQAGLAAGQVVSIYGNNGEFFNNGVNTQPYTLLIDTYYPVTKSDGSYEQVPLPKGSTIWADAPFDYNKIAPEHKGSFPDPNDGNNQFQRYSWASVDGVTVNGGLIPMRKDTIVIDNVYTGQTMSAEGDTKAPAKAVTPSTPVAIGAYTDAAAKEQPPFNWKKAAGIGLAVAGGLGVAYWWFKVRKK